MRRKFFFIRFAVILVACVVIAVSLGYLSFLSSFSLGFPSSLFGGISSSLFGGGIVLIFVGVLLSASFLGGSETSSTAPTVVRPIYRGPVSGRGENALAFLAAGVIVLLIGFLFYLLIAL